MILVDGTVSDSISVLDRGLHYGDGLFETMVYKDGSIEFFDHHLNRLMLGCKRLGIIFTSLSSLKQEINTVCEQTKGDAVIKVIITRGQGSRGYLPPKNAVVTRIVSSHPYPHDLDRCHDQGITVRICQHRISENANLAGIKHLNRLDQVIARNEWHDEAIKEGLMLNSEGYLIEGTMSNIFVVSKGQLITPKLDKSGVAGIVRANIITLATKQNISVKEDNICQQTWLDAEEIFICNSVIHILPVTRIIGNSKTYPIGVVTRQLQQLLKDNC